MNQTCQMRPASDQNAPEGAPSSSFSPSLQYQLSGGQNSESVPVGMTRANLDQWKRNLKQQLQQKTQKLSSLHTETNSLLSGMQKQLIQQQQAYRPIRGSQNNWLSLYCRNSTKGVKAVQNLDAEISKLGKQVKELRSKLTAVTNRRKTDPRTLETGHTKPNKPCTVEDSELPAKQPSVLGFPVSPNQFQILSVNEAQESELSPRTEIRRPKEDQSSKTTGFISGRGTWNLAGK